MLLTDPRTAYLLLIPLLLTGATYAWIRQAGVRSSAWRNLTTLTALFGLAAGLAAASRAGGLAWGIPLVSLGALVALHHQRRAERSAS